MGPEGIEPSSSGNSEEITGARYNDPLYDGPVD